MNTLSLSDAFFNATYPEGCSSGIIREAFYSFREIPNTPKGLRMLEEKMESIYNQKTQTVEPDLITESTVRFSSLSDAEVFSEVAEKLGIPVSQMGDRMNFTVNDASLNSTQKQMLPHIVNDVNGTLVEEQDRFVGFLKESLENREPSTYTFANGENADYSPQQIKSLVETFDRAGHKKQQALLERLVRKDLVEGLLNEAALPRKIKSRKSSKPKKPLPKGYTISKNFSGYSVYHNEYGTVGLHQSRKDAVKQAHKHDYETRTYTGRY